ncbi:MAG: isoprenylcysteine carboxylmethyltransferase family protein [Candidatus Heimdallarchaeota archaeon]|nr:MAG: isoprenylcysteine carboxylmethyltransferase family protein [Candidatus Heimdallarchaeota archaeon]
MKPLIRKMLYIILWYVVYPNFWLLLLASDIYFKPENLIFLLTLLISYIMGIIDTIIRPFSESIEEDWTTNRLYTMIILALFLFNPIIIALSFYESKLIVANYFPTWNTLPVSILGIFILMIGGCITITGRYQLKQFGEGVLNVKEDQTLITTGIFSYIRHPIYAGGIIGVFGLYLAFGSFFVLIGIWISYFVVFRHRLLFEEKMMTEAFGDEYREYMKHSKRLIPFLY